MALFRELIYNPAQHDFFDEIATLFVNLGSFNAAIESFVNSSSTAIPNSPDHCLNLYGRVANVSFPIHSLMHGIIQNKWPTSIQLRIHPSTQVLSGILNGVELQSSGVSKMLTQLVGTMFLKYYERNSDRVKSAYSSSQETWPEVWRFAWLLRNAIAHGDKWNLNDPNFPTTTWQGITVTQSDSGEEWYQLRRYIGGGDVILLMDELNSHAWE